MAWPPPDASIAAQALVADSVGEEDDEDDDGDVDEEDEDDDGDVDEIPFRVAAALRRASIFCFFPSAVKKFPGEIVWFLPNGRWISVPSAVSS